MKKFGIVISFIFIFLITGCSDMMNTPSKRVEEFLGKYQTMDSDVLDDLDKTVDKEDYSEDFKKEYKSLLQKQYQNLSYKIKDEKTDGDTATVEVEIEVFDYRSALDKSDDYIEEHKDEFESEDEIDSTDSDKKKEDYHINQLKGVTDKVNYTIVFHLTKKDKKWELEKLSDSDLEKIHGLYNND